MLDEPEDDSPKLASMTQNQLREIWDYANAVRSSVRFLADQLTAEMLLERFPELAALDIGAALLEARMETDFIRQVVVEAASNEPGMSAISKEYAASAYKGADINETKRRH